MTGGTPSEPFLLRSIGNIVAERPSRASVLEHWGLDYCCGGKKQFGIACGENGLNVDQVLRDLLNSDASSVKAAERDWHNAPLTELIDNIVGTHHAYLSNALPRLSGLIDRVVKAHGDRNPRLFELQIVFAGLRNPLECHTEEEESVLFPRITLIENSEKPMPFTNSLRIHIEALEHDHEHAGASLAAMRSLTNGYSPPPFACATYCAMLDGLAELEADMHRHVHKENSILFPRALELVSQRSDSAAAASAVTLKV